MYLGKKSEDSIKVLNKYMKKVQILTKKILVKKVDMSALRECMVRSKAEIALLTRERSS